MKKESLGIEIFHNATVFIKHVISGTILFFPLIIYGIWLFPFMGASHAATIDQSIQQVDTGIFWLIITAIADFIWIFIFGISIIFRYILED
jgi:ABC-type Na+ efflux pump permease subunit